MNLEEAQALLEVLRRDPRAFNKVQNANRFLVLPKQDGSFDALPFAWAAHLLSGGDPTDTRASGKEAPLRSDLLATGWRVVFPGQMEFQALFEAYLDFGSDFAPVRRDWKDGRRKQLAGHLGQWEFWVPPHRATSATKDEVLQAMKRISRGERPAGFKEARVWFVRDPDGGAVLPAKQVWGLANGLQGRDFTAHQAREKLRGLGFQLIGPDQPAAEIAESPASLEALPPSFEGAERQVTRNVRERDPAARAACEAHYRKKDSGRLRCQACDFDFGKVFGKLGEGFMHFHHKSPLSEAVGERQVDGPRDLVPLCPNCHAMAHRGETLLSVEELRGLIERHTER